MKKIIFTLVILNSSFLIAQWQTDVRLTNDPANSQTSLGNAWCIAANGSVVHSVWADTRDGNWDIYYKRSTDAGVSWGADTRLTNDAAASWSPSVAVSDSVVHAVWQDTRNGDYEIYYKRSNDGGLNWGTDTRLTNYAAESWYSSAAVSGSVVHVVWEDNRDVNAGIFYKRSTDAGVSWGADTRLTNTSSSTLYPSVAVSGSAVHVVWFDRRDGNDQIFYKRSTDGGVNWGADARLTNDSAHSWLPSVAVSGSVVHIVWTEFNGVSLKIYYKRSTDGGVSWAPHTQLTGSTVSLYPSLAVSGSSVHIVWRDHRDGNSEIYYKRSTDAGVSWAADTRLTNDTSRSYNPSAAVAGSIVHIVWQDRRDGNYEIYYKRDPTGNPVGIININSGIPKEFKLKQNYPNPFNPMTKIKFDNPPSPLSERGDRGGFIRLIVFDVLGREVATLVNEELKPGTYEVEWDGTNFPGGVYFYNLTSGEYTESKKMLLIK